MPKSQQETEKIRAIINQFKKHMHPEISSGKLFYIYPSEFDKIQVLDIFNENDYDEIIYFGDKYYIGGNDYKLLHHPRINGYQSDSPIMTNNILIDNFLNISLK